MPKQVGKVRRVFPGGNTYKGFYSYYDYILSQEDAKRIIVIKGGPGVGKSSFMKKLGEAMVNKGYDVEYHHCSSDNNSVDGVVFPEIGVALMDGTAPHVVDPKNPGAVDEIIHLGDYWDEDKMMSLKEDILRENSEVGRYFKRAYGYLSSAKGIYDNIKQNIDATVDKFLVSRLIEEIKLELFKEVKNVPRYGEERHLFSSAITPTGVKDYLDTIVPQNDTVLLLSGEYDSSQSHILKAIGQDALNKGYDVEFFHNHFIPEKVDNVVINDLSIAVTTSAKFVDTVNKIYDIDQTLVAEILDTRISEIETDNVVFDDLIDSAVNNIKKAKNVHDVMEEYYIPNMDFEAIDFLRENVLDKILFIAENM